MKVTLDLDALLDAGKIDYGEYEKLRQLSARTTAGLAFNLLVGFGVVAVSAATLALAPSAGTAVVLGAGVGGAGLVLAHRGEVQGGGQWAVLSKICLVVGALLLGGGVVRAGDGSAVAFGGVTAVLALAGVVARSGLLTALAVLALATCLGAGTAYGHATYYLAVPKPGETVLVFAGLAALAALASARVPPRDRSVAAAAYRTAVLVANFGFWVGSLWGGDDRGGVAGALPAWVFALGWATALIAAGALAWKYDRRWELNLVAVFGGIHLYTQWFEHLGATPGTLLLAGLFALGFAIWLRSVNQRLATRTS